MPDSVCTVRVPVTQPFRLDLTAVVLRRLSRNAVDVFDGMTYHRALGTADAPLILTVTQSTPDVLEATLRGAGADALDVPAIVQRTFGTEHTLEAFYAGTQRRPWLHAIAEGARGVRPPRYPTLWETICNAVIYQQISIHAAGAILRRVIERYAQPVTSEAMTLHVFPSPETLAVAEPTELRALGLSVQKITALKLAAQAVLTGALDGDALAALPTAELLETLTLQRGIGPWTAAVIALRGYARLDVFPMRDSGVAAMLKALSGDPELRAEDVIGELAPQQGMLYYHLLLGRLAASGEAQLAVTDR
jgi:DNA-3-methyladenine glycosylase II